MSSTCVSCPGKVLIAGGYLVLERAYRGLVVATASRFYTTVRKAGSSQTLRLTVSAPQFDDPAWDYEVQTSATDCTCHALEGTASNPFVETAVRETCRIVMAHRGALPCEMLDVFVLGDNDFYSQREADPVPFEQLHTTLAHVHKTGLGSSAAMVSSLVGALLLHLGVDITAERALLHNLAQHVHSQAQGKIGSGFDVSAAVYGSQLYRRFSPACLESPAASSGGDLLRLLHPRSNAAWRDVSTCAQVDKFALPPLTVLVLAEVDMGSHTPSMVSKVLAWRNKDSAIANALWSSIAESNDGLAASFSALNHLYRQDETVYASAMSRLAAGAAQNGQKVDDLLLQVRRQIKTLRAAMRSMGEGADVPIEPPSQAVLLDQIEQHVCVLGSGVPGAGGYDAVWVLVAEPTGNNGGSMVETVEKSLRHYQGGSVRPLSTSARVYGVRAVDETAFAETDGMRIEEESVVAGLSRAIAACPRVSNTNI